MPHGEDNLKMSYQERLLLKEAVESRHCEALGRVLTSFQHLEHRLTEIVGYLVDKHDFQLGIIITSEISFRNLINLAYSLAPHRKMDLERVDSLREILKDCFAAEQRRNQLIHSYWEPEPESLQVTRFKYTAKYSKGYKHQIEDVTEVNLLEFAGDLIGLSLDLTELMDAHESNWSKYTTFPNPDNPSSSLLPKNLQSALNEEENA